MAKVLIPSSNKIVGICTCQRSFYQNSQFPLIETDPQKNGECPLCGQEYTRFYGEWLDLADIGRKFDKIWVKLAEILAGHLIDKSVLDIGELITNIRNALGIKEK